jgi:hypothetical protein
MTASAMRQPDCLHSVALDLNWRAWLMKARVEDESLDILTSELLSDGPADAAACVSSWHDGWIIASPMR